MKILNKNERFFPNKISKYVNKLNYSNYESVIPTQELTNRSQ